jgi:histidine triad (HIT) family protein
MASIFSRIIAGEIPCYKVAEDDNCFAFLDISPVSKGHTLVVPKLEVDRMYDLPEGTYNDLHTFARRVALAMRATFDCNRIGSTVIGLEVPHVHIHLIPITVMADMDFSRPKLQLSPDEMSQIAASIAANL